MRKVLVTGATGYVGGRLVRVLLEQGFQVRVMVRDIRKLDQHTWSSQVEVFVGNVNNYESNLKALEGVHTAFYLLHAIDSNTNFHKTETEMANAFGRAAHDAKISQIIYLGGIANDTKKSRHLQSRSDTGKELASHGVPEIGRAHV